MARRMPAKGRLITTSSEAATPWPNGLRRKSEYAIPMSEAVTTRTPPDSDGEADTTSPTPCSAAVNTAAPTTRALRQPGARDMPRSMADMKTSSTTEQAEKTVARFTKRLARHGSEEVGRGPFSAGPRFFVSAGGRPSHWRDRDGRSHGSGPDASSLREMPSRAPHCRDRMFVTSQPHRRRASLGNTALPYIHQCRDAHSSRNATCSALAARGRQRSMRSGRS